MNRMVQLFNSKVRWPVRDLLEKTLKGYFKGSIVNKNPKRKILQFLYGIVSDQRYSIATLTAIEALDNRYRTVLYNEEKGFSYGQRSIDGLANSETFILPSLGYAHLQGALVNPDNSLVQWKNKALFQRTGAHERQLIAVYPGAQIEKQEHDRILFHNTPPIPIAKGISMCGNYPLNWYHWSIEILSRSALFEELPKEYNDYPLLVPSSVLKSANHRQILEFATNRSIIELEDDQSYKVHNCIIIDSPAFAPPNTVKGYLDIQLNDQVIWPKLMTRYRNNILNNIGSERLKKSSQLPDKIFLARPKTHRAYNQEEVFTVFEQMGFEMVFPESLSVVDQIRLFLHAKEIAGPAGAAWSNILYCSKGTKSLGFVPDFIGLEKHAAFSNLGNLNQVDCRWIYYRSKAADYLQFIGHKEYDVIDVEMVRKAAISLFTS